MKNSLAVETFVMSCQPHERVFYEMMINSSKFSVESFPVKLVFDIDIDGEIRSDDLKESYILELHDVTSRALYDVYGLYYSANNVIVLDSSGEYTGSDGSTKHKTSLHPIFDGIHFSNVKHMKDFLDTYVFCDDKIN